LFGRRNGGLGDAARRGACVSARERVGVIATSRLAATSSETPLTMLNFRTCFVNFIARLLKRSREARRDRTRCQPRNAVAPASLLLLNAITRTLKLDLSLTRTEQPGAQHFLPE